MSRWGISGRVIPTGLLYAGPIGKACQDRNFPPCFAYAIAARESIIGEMNGKWKASTVVSFDNGHGLFQLTSSWPSNWEDPYTNALYAIDNFLIPDIAQWIKRIPDLQANDLVRCAAASFNAGFGGAWSGHADGDVDKYTSDRYGQGVLDIYLNLLRKGEP